MLSFDACALRAQVVGSAIAISLLTYGLVPLWAGVLITAVASFLLLLLERLGVRHLEALFAVLIGTMAASFGVMYILAEVPTAQVLEGKALLKFPNTILYLMHSVVPVLSFKMDTLYIIILVVEDLAAALDQGKTSDKVLVEKWHPSRLP